MNHVCMYFIILNLTKIWIHVMHSLHQGKESGDPEPCMMSQYNITTSSIISTHIMHTRENDGWLL